MLWKIVRIVAGVLLLLLGAGGFQGLLNNLGGAQTPLQYSVFGAQVVLGLAGIVAGAGALLRKAWAGPAALVFAVGMAYAAGVGPVAWGETAWGRGVVDAAVGFLIGFVLFLGVRERGNSSTTRTT